MIFILHKHDYSVGMPVHSQEIPREDNGEAQSPFMWWIQLILISQLPPPPPETLPCPNMKIVACELLICLDLYWLVGSMICKSNNWTESGWYPLEWLDIVHIWSRLIDVTAGPMDVEMYIINVYEIVTHIHVYLQHLLVCDHVSRSQIRSKFLDSNWSIWP